MIEIATDMRIFQPPDSELTNAARYSSGNWTCSQLQV